MTALYIISGILLFLLILLLLPVRIRLEYDNDLRLWVGYTFLNFQVIPSKPKKPKKQKKKNQKTEPEEKKSEGEKKKKKNFILDYKDKHGLSGLLDLIKQITDIVVKVIGRTAKHLKIPYLEINAFIGGEDSADAAMKYGYACSVIYPALSLLQNSSKLRRFKEDISANFYSEKTAVELKLKAKMRLLWILWIVLAALFRAVVLIVKTRSAQS